MKIFEVLNQTTNLKSQFSRNDGKLVGKATDCFKTTFHFPFSIRKKTSLIRVVFILSTIAQILCSCLVDLVL